MTTFLDHQNWRYATKKFDAAQKISQADFATLLEAMRLSTSSYGLQPYKIIVVTDPELRAKLQPAAWGQSQIVDASHLIVFANMLNIGDAEINAYLKNISQTRSIPEEGLEGYGSFMKSKISTLPAEDRNIWTAKQTYLALGNLINAAAELKIDATPMEGFEKDAFNEILGLTEKGLSASVIATLGYRHQEDATQHYKKVRKANEELFITL